MDLTTVCDCPELPVNRWYRDGQLIEERVLADDTGQRDFDDYAASDANAFVMLCPTCGQVYAQGHK